MKRFVMLTVLTMTACLFLTGLAVAQDKQPDATVELTQGQVAVGIGWSWGEGVLTYKGQKYPVKVEGLSVIDVGITRAEAAGKIYGLKSWKTLTASTPPLRQKGRSAGAQVQPR